MKIVLGCIAFGLLMVGGYIAGGGDGLAAVLVFVLGCLVAAVPVLAFSRGAAYGRRAREVGPSRVLSVRHLVQRTFLVYCILVAAVLAVLFVGDETDVSSLFAFLLLAPGIALAIALAALIAMDRNRNA
jgi:hypothetical protein